MTYANSLLNRSITKCDIYDDEKLKLFTGRVSNVSSIVETLNHHGCYIDMSESDITRLEDGDLIFAFGDKITTISIGITFDENPAGDYIRKNWLRKTVLRYVGVDDGFVVIDEYV